MRISRSRMVAKPFVLVLWLLAACTLPPPPQAPVAAPVSTAAPAEQAGIDVDLTALPRRVLFLGPNSFSTNPIDQPILAGMVAEAYPDLGFEAGYREQLIGRPPVLQPLIDHPETQELIASGEWDVVFLEEGIPWWRSAQEDFDEEMYYQEVETLAEAIRDAGGTPALYMTLLYPYDDPNMPLEELQAMVTTAADRIDGPVAPIGLALARAEAAQPDWEWRQEDRVHPTHRLGAYLMASVVYATLYGMSPEGIAFTPWDAHEGEYADRKGTDAYADAQKAYDLTPEERAFLHRIAWETVQAFGRTVTSVQP